MKSIQRICSILIFLAIIPLANAQPFLKTDAPGKKLTFVEMQLRFDNWSKKTNLSETKYWKYYKRWESDMLLKTNGKGELADSKIYIDAAIQASKDKKAIPTSKFAAASWSPDGPYALPGNLTGYMENGIGRINCIAFHPTLPSTYFVGVAQGGLWKTTNNGTTWTPLTDNLPITRISDICIDPNNTDIMYISLCDFEYIDVALNLDGRKRNTHYGLGVYKTTDGGLSWAPTGLSFQLTDGDASLIRKILVNPANSNQLVAAGVNGMYTSGNAGTTWTHTLDSLFWDLTQDPITPSTLYAASGWLATSNTGSAAIYKSTNFGLTWTMLPTGIPATGAVQRIKIAVAASDPNYVYAFAVDAFDGMYGIYKSTDAGASWTFSNPGVNVLEYDQGFNPGGQGTYDLGFTVNRTDKNILYTGGVNVWTSTDGGASFNPVSHWTLSYGPTLHGDIHFIETQPLTGNVFVCSDGGLYRTSNIVGQTWSTASGGSPWPTAWTIISNGMAITSFYRLSSSRNLAGRLCAGAQDNATFYYDGSSWNTIFGGDGMDNYLDPLDNNVIIGSSQYGNFYLSTDGGFSGFDPGVNVNSENGEWVSPIVADYTIPGTIYVGFSSTISKSTDAGNTWTGLSSLPFNGIYNNEMSALAVANSNSNVIYATRRIRFEFNSPSSAYVSTDGGSSWSDVTSNLPDSLYYTSIHVSQTDANTAYIALGGLTAGEKVYKTINAGLTWTNISFNLPNAPVNSIKTAPVTNALIVATDFGVYLFDEILNTWVDESAGLPNVIISDIEFNAALNKVYVCTFGRGIWETNMDALLGTGINNEQTNNIDIELYPSPNNGNFSIHLLNDKINDNGMQLDIVDITGRIVYTSNLKGGSTYNLETKLNSGMYFAKLKSKSFNGVKSFVVK